MTQKNRFFAFRLALISILFSVLAGTVSAQDEEESEDQVGIYGTIRGGVSFPSASFEAYDEDAGYQDFYAGYEVGFSGGVQLTEWIRWDVLDFSYSSWGWPHNGFGPKDSWSSLPDGLTLGYAGSGLSLTTGFRFGDFRASSRFHPYMSVGLGGGRAKVDLNGEETAEWGINANVGAGVEYVVSDHLAVGLRYQFRWIGADVRFPPVGTTSGLRLVQMSVKYQTLAVEFVFF